MNELFEIQMRELLKDEFDSYMECLSQQPQKGFRINTLKTDAAHLFSCVNLNPVQHPFADNGYYTDVERGIGYTPEYMAGTFYMQEPSASSAVTILDPKPGLNILDMCAAPGSKSTQIAEKMSHQGLLVCNEINPKRAAVLVENIERHGCANAVVTNSDTSLLADELGGFFDMVLCDAPCSGEGMMRKEDEASRQWSPKLVSDCAQLQKEILENAYRCLKPGGVLVYSTCTLNMQENELQILQFLKNHPDMHMDDAHVHFGRRAMISDFGIDQAVRIFPMDGGEGHFIARMVKDGVSGSVQLLVLKSERIQKDTMETLRNTIEKDYPYMYAYHGYVYGGTNPFYDFGKVRVMRAQVRLGEEKKGRFECDHHLFMSAWSPFVKRYEMNDAEVRKYMHGEQISGSIGKGWTAMCYHDNVMGGAKSDGKVLKNHFPKAFRIR
ncbi:MAG: NOL1/NOP2/sun family putative RNA methylase [Bulleidia sp.]